MSVTNRGGRPRIKALHELLKVSFDHGVSRKVREDWPGKKGEKSRINAIMSKSETAYARGTRSKRNVELGENVSKMRNFEILGFPQRAAWNDDVCAAIGKVVARIAGKSQRILIDRKIREARFRVSTVRES